MIIRQLKPSEVHTPCDTKGCILGAIGALEWPDQFRLEYVCYIHAKSAIDQWEKDAEIEDKQTSQWWER